MSEVCFLKEKKGRKENEGEYMPLHKLRYFIVAMLVLSCLLVADFVEAKEVSTARTEGVIRFVGGQEPRHMSLLLKYWIPVVDTTAGR